MVLVDKQATTTLFNCIIIQAEVSAEQTKRDDFSRHLRKALFFPSCVSGLLLWWWKVVVSNVAGGCFYGGVSCFSAGGCDYGDGSAAGDRDGCAGDGDGCVVSHSGAAGDGGGRYGHRL